MSLNVQVIGLDKALRDLDNYLVRKRQALLGVVSFSADALTMEAKRNAPVDLGELRNDIGYTVKDTKDRIIAGILSSAPYSAFVEFGTRPHRAPASAIKGWADRHGIPLGAVLHSIATKGTPAQPFMFPAYVKVKPKFIRGVKEVMKSP